MAPNHSLDLIHVSELEDRGRITALYRRLADGRVRRLHPGVHIDARAYAALSVDERYVTRVLAARSRLGPHDTVSHWSAAALWGLPAVDGWPPDVHTTVPAATALTSTRSLHRHRSSRAVLEPATLAGLAITPLARTVIDVAATNDFPASVAAADAALFSVARGDHPGRTVESFLAELAHELTALGSMPGGGRARRVVAFADPGANRPGESLSRVAMHRLGAPAPTLQYPIVGASGRTWHTDFGWPDLGVVAEFDGRMKYLEEQYRGGRSAAEVVYDEKLREDDIRPSVRSFGRWDWATARSLDRMRVALHRIGVPTARR